jgi:hypothetical protein
MSQSQRAYLWLYDWTGIYVATLDLMLTAVFVVVNVSYNNMGIVVSLILLVLRGIFMWAKYWQQDTGNLDRFNAEARQWQNSNVRWLSNGSFFGFVVFDALSRNVIVIGDLAFFVLSYLLTVQIREREPRDFKIGVGKMASQGT